MINLRLTKQIKIKIMMFELYIQELLETQTDPRTKKL